MINGPMMKQALYGLNDSMRAVGREVNVEEVAEIVHEHATATALSAAASGIIPGAGGVIAFGIACTSTISMYGRLARAMGVRLDNGLIRAVASAVVADLAAEVTAIIVATAAVSFIPGVGNMAASTLTAITNYAFVYLAGYIFIQMISSLGVQKMENMSENDIKAAARNAQNGINMKAAMKEARQSYKANS